MSKLCYLTARFESNLWIIEGELRGESQKLDKTIIRNDIEFHLVHTHSETQFGRMNYVAYYLGGPGFDTADDVKRKLEELGHFNEIALNYGGMCAQLQLMVSPASTQYPSLFELNSDEFELIEENQHVGKSICFILPI